MERRLAVILAADVVGFSRLMGEDEAGTLAALKAHRTELLDPEITRHKGRIVKLMGDGALVEFASVVDAVECAVDIQRGMVMRNAGVPENTRIAFRIGINLGDVIVEGDDIYGDSVNVAARLEGIARPGGICISGTAYDQLGTKVNVGYEDLGGQRVKNITEPVRAYAVLIEPKAAGTVVGARRRAKTLLRPVVLAGALVVLIAVAAAGWWQNWKQETHVPPAGKISIAVLPFDNMSGDPDQGYFSDGITEDLITDISQISGLFVVARNTMFTYKDRAVNVRELGEELGVQYVLEGSVRREGNRVRVNVQLIDAANGLHLWAERFDREMNDVFALQDEVVQKIVSALAITLTPDEQEQLSQAGQANPEAYDLLLRGLERFRRFTRETNVEARGYFERAAAVDPYFARAHADIALTHAEDIFHGWTDSPERSSRLAVENAQYALKLDSKSRVAHFALAFTYLNMTRYDEALTETRLQLDLFPNHAESYAQRGLILSYVGRPAEGLEAIQTAMRLDPRAPFFYVWILGQAKFLLKQTDEAIAQFENAIERNPEFSIGHVMLASAYAHAGRIEDARWEAQEVLALLPDFTLTLEREGAPYKDPAHLDYYLEGLRKAGLPE